MSAPTCHLCGLLFLHPELEVGTAALFKCFDPECPGWLILYDQRHLSHIAKVLDEFEITNFEDLTEEEAEPIREMLRLSGKSICTSSERSG